MKRLPTLVPEATPDDELAAFAAPLYIEPGTDFWEEASDPTLNRLLGFGKTDEEVKQVI
jgi:hypothetical protein